MRLASQSRAFSSAWIHYTTTALAAARKLHEQLFLALEATEIGHLPYAEGAGHIMGTTRMGADARTSVAEREGTKP